MSNRNFKASKVPKPEVDLEVKILIALKAQYKLASGVDWQAPAAAPAAAPSASGAAALNQKVVDQVSRLFERKGFRSRRKSRKRHTNLNCKGKQSKTGEMFEEHQRTNLCRNSYAGEAYC